LERLQREAANMTTIERDEINQVPEADPIRMAVAGLISAMMAAMPDCPERVVVIGEIKVRFIFAANSWRNAAIAASRVAA
jgi:hypothetical protein